MVQEITSTELVQRCGKCDRENRIVLADLEVGLECADQVDDSVVPLPECQTCHSREFLLRSTAEEQEHPAQGSAGYLHWLMVDELHSQLVNKGRVVAGLKNRTAEVFTRPLAAEVRACFFGKGLKLPVRAVEELQGKRNKSGCAEAER